MITNLKRLNKHVKQINADEDAGLFPFPIVSLNHKHNINKECDNDLNESYHTCNILSAMHKAQRYTKKNQR